MQRSEFSKERITHGLPTAIHGVPPKLVDALDRGVIKESDLEPNIAATVSTNHRPEINPPLNIFEQVERTKHIRQLAANCVEKFLTQ